MLAIALFKIRLLKTGFQPNYVSLWKNLSVGIPLPCEREGKFVTVVACQKIPAGSDDMIADPVRVSEDL